MIALLTEELNSLRTVIEYFWEEEREDYKVNLDGPRQEAHILRHLVVTKQLYERLSGFSLPLED